ncbi:MAG: biopolymer transporter ExbD [Deltaproteobacteria bacterium]|nr:biopolymer transporter ExbD [Deltaproteobacteria bacterium]
MADDVLDTPTQPEPGANNFPDPALFAPKPGAKKRHKRAPHAPKADISINSLLDILSVILMFLLKSYTSSSVVLKQSKDLVPPFSASTIAAEDSTAVTITMKDILLQDKPIVQLENGKVTDRDTSHAGMLIEPLFSALQDEVQHQRKIEARNPKSPFKGIVTIIADRNVPSPAIVKVMYTAGLAEYGKFKFLLVKLERG